MKKVPLKMLKYFNGINRGEIAGYSEEQAKKLVENGVAKYYNENDKEESKEKPEKLEAKVMMHVEDILNFNIDDIKEELGATASNGDYLYTHEYISDMIDMESLNKGRTSLMDYLLEEVRQRKNV